MEDAFTGFDWDAGNLEKCAKHGVTRDEIEALFERTIRVFPARENAQLETRSFGIGVTQAGRYVFLVFTVRKRNGLRLIRPISARYMHQKEVDHYEQTIAGSPK